MEQIKETMHALGGYLERQISEKKFFAEENGMQVYIDRLLNLGTMADADVENMLGIMKRIETVLKAWIRDGEHLYAMEKEFSLAYWKIIRAMDYENGRQREEQQTYNYSMKLFVRDMLEFENGNDQSYSLILNNLEWLHIDARVSLCVWGAADPSVPGRNLRHRNHSLSSSESGKMRE